MIFSLLFTIFSLLYTLQNLHKVLLHIDAEGIIKSVKDALKDWQKAAKRFGAQEREINLFSQRFITE